MASNDLLAIFSTVLTIVISLSALYYSRAENRRQRARDNDAELSVKIDTRIVGAIGRLGLDEIKDRMARVETTVEIFTRAVGMDAARTLHSPHPEMRHRDMLLERLLGEEITAPEQGELYRMLYGSAFGPHTEGLPAGERVAASLVLRMLDGMGASDRNTAERMHTLDQPTMRCVLTVLDGRIVEASGDVEGVLGWTDVRSLCGLDASVVMPWGQLEDDATHDRIPTGSPSLDFPHHRVVIDLTGRERPVWVTVRNVPDQLGRADVVVETRNPDAPASDKLRGV